MALGVIDSEYRANISEQSAKELAIKAIKSSIQRDSASGDGIDLLFVTQKPQRDESLTL
jgi:proteasome beta subunit